MSEERLSRDSRSLAGRLLAAGDRDEPSPRAVQKVFLAVGIASGLSGAAGAASAGTTVGTLALIKWLTVGAIAGASVMLAGGEIANRSGGEQPLAAQQASSAAAPQPSLGPTASAAPPAASFAELAAPAPPASAPRLNMAKQAPPIEPAASAPVKAPDTLSEEAAAIERAASAVRRRDGAAALSALDEHRVRFPRARLYPEATVLRVEALLLLGRRDAARDIAQRFLSAHPESPSAKRLGSLVGTGADP